MSSEYRDALKYFKPIWARQDLAQEIQNTQILNEMKTQLKDLIGCRVLLKYNKHRVEADVISLTENSVQYKIYENDKEYLHWEGIWNTEIYELLYRPSTEKINELEEQIKKLNLEIKKLKNEI